MAIRGVPQTEDGQSLDEAGEIGMEWVEGSDVQRKWMMGLAA